MNKLVAGLLGVAGLLAVSAAQAQPTVQAAEVPAGAAMVQTVQYAGGLPIIRRGYGYHPHYRRFYGHRFYHRSFHRYHGFGGHRGFGYRRY